MQTTTTTRQPAPEALAAARRRLGCTQQALADRLVTRGARCSAYTVERWETSSPRHRDVPERIWTEVRDLLGVEDIAVATPHTPLGHDSDAGAVSAPSIVRLAPLLRPASPETCLSACRCPRFECGRCGAVVVGPEAQLHVCAALSVLLAPSPELLAVLAERDLAEDDVA